jgi:hypothetical protein
MAFSRVEFFFGKDLHFYPLSCIQGNTLNRQWFEDSFTNYDYQWFPETLKNRRYELINTFTSLVYTYANRDNFFATMFSLLTAGVISTYTSVTNVTGKYFTIEQTGTMDIDTVTNICSSLNLTNKIYVY